MKLCLQIAGLGVIIAGVLVLSEISDFNYFLEGRMMTPPIILMVAGTIVFIITFFGCYGAMKKNYNFLVAVKR